MINITEHEMKAVSELISTVGAGAAQQEWAQQLIDYITPIALSGGYVLTGIKLFSSAYRFSYGENVKAFSEAKMAVGGFFCLKLTPRFLEIIANIADASFNQ